MFKINNSIQINPELEALRQEGLQNTEEDDFEEILLKLENIHAAYLFKGVGLKALQKLCLHLSATPDRLYMEGWQTFAIKLGLEPVLTKVIENNNIYNQDPTHNVILAFVQHEHSTMNKIIIALKQIQRYDIIKETYKLFLELAERIINSTDGDINQQLLKPRNIPKAPLVLTNLEKQTEKIITKKFHYDKIIMLTFAPDCNHIARMVAYELRKPRNQIIGVIILEEHNTKVNADPENFIRDCFNQSNYIMPILSIGYLDTISTNTPIYSSAVENLDNVYVKYIHKLISNSYMRNGCCNKNIRGLVPDLMADGIQKHPAMLNSELRVWVNTSQIETLADRILSNKF